MTPEREEIAIEARRWIGTPFRHQGRTPLGIDCIGLLIVVCKRLRLVEQGFEFTGYSRSPDGKSLLTISDLHMNRIEQKSMRIGDVAVIKWRRHPQHFGIVGNYLHGGFSLIHAYGTVDGKGSVVEHHLDSGIAKRIVAAYALPGIS